MENTVIWSPGMTIDALEESVIKKAYRFYRNNKTTTASALGISIRTLDNKLEKYEMGAVAQEAEDEHRRKEREYQLARSRGLAPIEIGVVNQANPRIRMESTPNVAAQSTVSVPERSEVQEMLPKQAAGGGIRKSR